MARINHEVTTGQEGIELLESRDYVDEKTGAPGRYTKKVYHLESRVPGWVKLLAPSSALKLDEESWDAFPSCKTVIINKKKTAGTSKILGSRCSQNTLGKDHLDSECSFGVL